MEAGDRAPRRRSATEWACWPDVGGQRLPVVDTWTSRRLCTASSRCPRPLPWLPPFRPQVGGSDSTEDDAQGSQAPERRWSRRDATALRRRPSAGRRGGTKPAHMTSRHPLDTRSPQAVHIPGDNFSTSRRRSPCGIARLRRGNRGMTAAIGCGQNPRRARGLPLRRDDAAQRDRGRPEAHGRRSVHAEWGPEAHGRRRVHAEWGPEVPA